VPKSHTLKSTFRTILKDFNKIWLMVLVTVFIIILPLYVNKRFL